jgi:hypothetical protein
MEGEHIYAIRTIRFMPCAIVLVYDPNRKTYESYSQHIVREDLSPEEAFQLIENTIKAGNSIHVFNAYSEDAFEAIALVESLQKSA